MIQHTRTLLWRALAVVAVVLAVVGAVLPVLPTVPFLLVAAWAGGKGWPALEAWLLGHPVWGPPIRRWREHGAIPRQAKWLATVMMAGSATVLWFAPVPPWVRGLVYLTMVSVATWMWRRPEGPSG
ncbi:MAG: hypothetical protein RI907_578 [Pseudomonadota bacterium]|jgi:uncharacterized membrane protein YbaN (DUF454 family)